jgi:hypothetical protein
VGQIVRPVFIVPGYIQELHCKLIEGMEHL